MEQVWADGGARAGEAGREVRPKSLTVDLHSHWACRGRAHS